MQEQQLTLAFPWPEVKSKVTGSNRSVSVLFRWPTSLSSERNGSILCVDWSCKTTTCKLYKITLLEHLQYNRLASNQSSCEAWIALKKWKMVQYVSAVVFLLPGRYLIYVIKFIRGLKLPSFHSVRKWIFICVPYMMKVPINLSFSIYVRRRKFVLSIRLV